MESYYKLLTLRILTLSIIPIRKIVNSSLKNRNIRIRRSGSLNQASIRSQVIES